MLRQKLFVSSMEILSITVESCGYHTLTPCEAQRLMGVADSLNDGVS